MKFRHMGQKCIGSNTLLAPLDWAPVECDGMARLVATVLHREGIEYRALVGKIIVNGRSVSPHYWIEVAPWRIDYRARMWFGMREEIPHGVFSPESHQMIEYQGSEARIEAMPQWLLDSLIHPFVSEA